MKGAVKWIFGIVLAFAATYFTGLLGEWLPSPRELLCTLSLNECSIIFTISPNPALQGEEVTISLSEPYLNTRVFFNDRQLPKEVFDSGRLILVTIPGDATSGSITIELPNGQMNSMPIDVIGNTFTPPLQPGHYRAPSVEQ